jgi:hypothetical protein
MDLETIAYQQQLILIQLMRLYDVQMSILSHFNDTRAEKLEKIHDEGKTVTDIPWILDNEEEVDRSAEHA